MRKVAVIALSFAQVVGAQVITTYAGTSWVFPSISLPALNAPLGKISGIAVDTQGNAYLADPSNSLILKMTPEGNLLVVAGNGQPGHSGDNGPAVNASINPSDVAVDSHGNVYIQDQSYIRMVTASGTITTIAGTGKFSSGLSPDGPANTVDINALAGMAFDSSGTLYFADTFDDCVRKIASGAIVTVAGKCGIAGFSGDGGGPASALLNQPSGLAFDSAGNLYIADTGNQRIREISGQAISTIAGRSQFASPGGLAIDPRGNLYVADSSLNEVLQINTTVSPMPVTAYAGSGTAVGGYSGDGGPALQAKLNVPMGLALDAGGNLYIADSGNYRLRAIASASRNIATVAGDGLYRFGGDGGQAIDAQLNSPTGIAVDSKGNMYFADTGNNRVRMVTPAGIIATVAGGALLEYPAGDNGPATGASLNSPTDVALDSAGNLYIADSGNSVVREVLPSGTITTVAGGGTSYKDNIAPGAISLINPVAVAVDANNSLYIADAGCNKVYQVKSAQISTFAGQPNTCSNPGYIGDGGNANVGTLLNSPEGLAFDTAGNLYIADTGNNVIRKVSKSGTISTFAGIYGNTVSGGDGVSPTSSGLDQPYAVAADASGNVYVADFDGKIREVTGGLIQTIAGGGAPSLLGDGGPPTAAGLNQPEGIAVDNAGDVLIGDTGNGRVRKVLGNALPSKPGTQLPAWQISSSQLTFAQTSTGAAVPPQTIDLTPVANGSTPVVNGLDFSLTIASSPAAWLSVAISSGGTNITSGSMPASLTVTATPGNLPPGNYSGTINITAPNTATPSAVVNVSLTVPQPPPPQPAIGSDVSGGISFNAPLNSGALTSQFHILNTGGGTLSFTTTVTTGGGSWLSISPTGGSATPGGPATIAATVTPGSLSTGAYSGSIVVTGAGVATPLVIPVNLTVSGAAAVMLVSQAAITFNAVSGAGSPLPQNFGVLNTGTGTMDWQASASSFVDGALASSNWLRVTPASGTVQQPYLDVSLVGVAVDPSNLPAGTYYGRITITSQAALNSPQLITVIVNVLPSGSPLLPEIFPTGLIFTGVAGVNPSSQDVTVGNSTNTPTSYQSQGIGAGFSFKPLNATQTNGAPTDVHVYPDFTNLSPGSTLHGGITFLFQDGTLENVSILTVVAPAGTVLGDSVNAKTGGGAVVPRASGCTPQSLEIAIRSLQANFPAIVGQGTSIEAQVTDSCGNLVSASPAQVFALLNTTRVNMNPIGNGIWQATWIPSSTGPVGLTVDALQPVGAGFVGGQSPTLAGMVAAVSSTSSTTGAPLTSAIVQAASQVVGLPIAPGELITIYGQNLASTTWTADSTTLPTEAAGLQVLLGVTPLPILFTDSGQMNVQVPYSVPLGTTYQLSVMNGASLSVPQTLSVGGGAPGIFTINSEGTGQGSIVHANSAVVADVNNPASIGEVVTIYCAGLGWLNNPAADPTIDKEGTAPDTAATTKSAVTANIGGANATISYAGVTPGSPGLYQINAQVPSGIQTGDNVPVQIAVAGMASQTVTMSIH